MLSAALRGYVCNGSLKQLEQCLLYALAGNVSRYGCIFALAGDLVYLVNVNYAVLGTLYVEIGSLEQTQKNILNVLADISCFGKSCCIRNGKRNVKNLR